jgi:hypothetical protein
MSRSAQNQWRQQKKYVITMMSSCGSQVLHRILPGFTRNDGPISPRDKTEKRMQSLCKCICVFGALKVCYAAVLDQKGTYNKNVEKNVGGIP